MKTALAVIIAGMLGFVVLRFGAAMPKPLATTLTVVFGLLVIGVAVRLVYFAVTNPVLAITMLLGGGLAIGIFWIVLIFYVAKVNPEAQVTVNKVFARLRGESEKVYPSPTPEAEIRKAIRAKHRP